MAFVDDLETEATEYLQELRAYRLHGGDDAVKNKRAKMALGVIGNYVRFRATMANERTNELVAKRLELMATPEAKQLQN